MDRYDSWYAREHTTHQDQVLDLIKDYHYFAPAMLALPQPKRNAGPKPRSAGGKNRSR